MAASTIIKHWRDGTLTIRDGTTPTPVELVIPFSLGDFKIGPLSKDQTETKKYKIRGDLQTIRKGESEEPQLSFGAAFADLADSTNRTIYDFVMGRNSYSANVSTTTAKGDKHTCDLQWDVAGVALGDPSNHQMICEDVDVRMDVSEGEPNGFAFSGEVLGDVSET